MHPESPVIPPASQHKLRRKIRSYYLKSESQVVRELIEDINLAEPDRQAIPALDVVEG